MKTINRLLILLSISSVLAACGSPKNDPRWTNEPAKNWKVMSTPNQADVPEAAFTDFDITKGYAELKDGKTDLTASILLPLSKVVLNNHFLSAAKYRTERLPPLINVFNRAFNAEWKKNPRSPEFGKIRDLYYQTVFAGCLRDMGRDQCVNASLFAQDGWHTVNMTLLANELDSQIAAQVKLAKTSQKCINESETCRGLVEERYRRLAMGVYKSNRNPDPDFSFSYMKYARMYALFMNYAKQNIPEKGPNDNSMSFSYLSQVHGKIFETLLGTYQPKDINDKDFVAFVNDFNPWSFSHKESDIFQYGTSIMFELGSKCCLYTDASKTQLNPGVVETIQQTQAIKDETGALVPVKDAFGQSFYGIIADIRKEYGERLFQKMGMTSMIAEIDAPNMKFYNEFFFIVDRLFRGHLNSTEVGMMLRNTSPERAKTELPKMITYYTKVYMLYMVTLTNKFMSDIYHSDIASNKVFEQAILHSREISGQWYTIQAQIDLLDKLSNSYFHDQVQSPEYVAQLNLLRAVNRNIYYISVYPNMIMLNYFLAQMKGSITVTSWFGQIQIDADTIIQKFFDGYIASPWFHFGKDTEPLDRLMLLYGLEYLTSTEGINAFVAKDSAGEGTERSKFFDMIFMKYVGETVNDLNTALTAYKKGFDANSNFSTAKSVCAYEAGTTNKLPDSMSINFLDLGQYTYSGIGVNGVNISLAAYLNGSQTMITSFLNEIDNRRTYVNSMIDVIEGDLLRNQTKDDPAQNIKAYKKGDAHPDLDKARAILKQFDAIQLEVTQLFMQDHKKYFDCALKLREIERRRANRLYDEEREYLGQVFDLMKPLASITDPKQLDAAVAALNQSYFKKQNYGLPYEALDHVEGLNFRMAQYDLLARIKMRIEKDVFMTPNLNEGRNYGVINALQVKPRAVLIQMPNDVTQENLYAHKVAGTVKLEGDTPADRETFINKGMAYLSGQSNAYVNWEQQFETDTTFESYIAMLESYYLLTPPGETIDPSLVVTKEELTDTYLKIMSTYPMDAFDISNAKLFGSYGRHPKEFYQGRMFDIDGVTPLPIFYNLQWTTYNMARIDVDGSGPVAESLMYARKFNSMQAFVFQPSQVIHDSILKRYGKRSHDRLKKVIDLFNHIADLEANAKDAASLAPEFANPVFLEGNTYFSWMKPGFKNILEIQSKKNTSNQLSYFIQRSGNFYSTKEEFKVGQ